MVGFNLVFRFMLFKDQQGHGCYFQDSCDDDGQGDVDQDINVRKFPGIYQCQEDQNGNDRDYQVGYQFLGFGFSTDHKVHNGVNDLKQTHGGKAVKQAGR